MNQNVLYKKVNDSIQGLSCFNDIDYALSLLKNDKDEYPHEIMILHEICLLGITIEDKKSPYKKITGDVIVGIAKNNSELLIEYLDNLENPFLLGRIADILWLTKNDTQIENPIQYAKKAIEKFSQLSLSFENYTGVHECYQRALILSKQTRQSIDKEYIATQLNNAVRSECNMETPFYQYNSAQILLSYDLISDYNLFTDMLMGIGEARYAQFGITFGTIEYLELALEACTKVKNKEKKISILKKIMQIYIEEADKSGHGLSARYFYEKALETARKIPVIERDEEITKTLNSLEAKIFNVGSTIIAQMNVVSSGQIDITEYQKAVIHSMSNIKNTKEALIRFSQISSKLKYSYIKEQCVQVNKGSFINAVCSIRPITHDGRSIGTLPIFDEHNTEVVEKYMIFHFNKHLLPILNQAYIDPSFQQFSIDHKVELDEIKQICQLSSIVPKDRIELISKALYYGFQEDFQTAIYLLSPQVENIVRQLLKANNISTTHIDKDNNQTENSLSALLDSPNIQNVLDKDILFMLKALFTSPLGPNLRNNIAHGMFNDEESYSQEVRYAWWFIFRWIMDTKKSI